MASCKECIHKTICAVYHDSLRETLERGGTMLVQCGEYSLAANVIEINQAQKIVKDFFCECIENDIMEIDVVDANAELCRRIEMAVPYIESRGKNGKKIDG